MDASRVKNFCMEYFHIEKPGSLGQGMKLGAKIVSYATLILPIVAGIALAISSARVWWTDRKIRPLTNDTSNPVKSVAAKVASKMSPLKEPPGLQPLTNDTSSNVPLTTTPAESVAAKVASKMSPLEELPGLRPLMNDTSSNVPPTTTPAESVAAKVASRMVPLEKPPGLQPLTNDTSKPAESVAAVVKDVARGASEMSSLEGLSELPLRNVLGYLSSRDLKNVFQTSRTLRAQAKAYGKECAVSIDNIVAIAKRIKFPQTGGFTFSTEKWEKISQEILNNPVLAAWADVCVKECYLDLVESLAEYNVKEHKEDAETVLFGIPGTDTKGLPDRQAALMTKILEDAKSTLKGGIGLGSILYGASPNEKIMLESDCKEPGKGVFFRCVLSNTESGDWVTQKYARYRGGNAIHVDWLIRNQGGRIVIPGEKDSNDKRIILRFWNSDPVAAEGLRKFLVYSVCRLFACKRDVDIDEKNRIMGELKEAYGEKLENMIEARVKKEAAEVEQFMHTYPDTLE